MFFVQFVLPGKVVHTVCVDFRRSAVWDISEEDYPVQFNADSLQLCCGVKATNNVQMRVLEVKKQREKKSTKAIEVVFLD